MKKGKKRYKETPADKALKAVRSGEHVLIGSGCAEPELLVDALVRRAQELNDVEVLHLLTTGKAPYSHPKYEGKFRHNAFFIGANVRSSVQRGYADYTPCFLHEIPRLLRSGRIPIDVALIQTTPPDANGYCSLGISVDILKAGIEAAHTVIAQVNPLMPRTHGDSFLHVSRIDAMVPGKTPLLEIPPEPPSETAREIGRYVSMLIENGATLQVGIGAIPDATLLHLTEKKDLGVHTEMFADGVMELIEAGVVTCALKNMHPRKVIASFCMGTRKLYDYVHDNPMFEFHGSDYINDPFVIAQNDRMTSVNSALQVDLSGQVCADSIGARLYSGVGGQVDFIRGASRSKGGKAIIALPSTARDGRVSRIVPILPAGAGVVTTRSDVDYVVTEHGIASLRGRTVRERALSLIQVAHPKFRKELLAEARKLKYVDKGQVPLRPYPVQHETCFAMKDGTEVHVRPLKPIDERPLRDLFYSQSDETITLRYRMPLRKLSQKQIQDFVTLDYDQKMAIGAYTRQGRASRLIGVARYYLDRATNMAQVAFTVHDRHQGQGLGSFLLGHLTHIARASGVVGFTAQVPVGNVRTMQLFQKFATNPTVNLKDDVYEISYLFPH